MTFPDLMEFLQIPVALVTLIAVPAWALLADDEPPWELIPIFWLVVAGALLGLQFLG